MAVKNTKKRTTSNRKKSSTNTTRKKAGSTTTDQMTSDKISTDIILLLVLAFSILLFLSAIGFGGTFGDVLSRFFFGLIGLLAYFIPFVFIIGTFFAVSNRENKVAIVKLVAVFFMVLFIATLFELIAHGSQTIGQIRSYHYGYENKTGGGFFGGFFAFIFCKGFGLVGAYVIDLIGFVICSIILTQKSAFVKLVDSSNKQKEKRVIRKKVRAEQEVAVKEEKEQQARESMERKEKARMERKYSGVSFNTQMEQPQMKASEKSDEITEITEISDATAFHNSNGSMVSSQRMDDKEHEIEDLNEKPVIAPEVQHVTIHSQLFDEETKDEQHEQQKEEQKEEQDELPEEALLCKTDIPEVTNSEGIKSLAKQMKAPVIPEIKNFVEEKTQVYQFPPISLLNLPVKKNTGNKKAILQDTADKLQTTLKNFGVNVTITDVSCGPAVTRYELQPEMGVKVSKIVNLADDIKLNLAAADIRIEAPIPGKAAVGIEVPNKETVMVSFRELVESLEFSSNKSTIAFAAGRDIGGNVIVSDIAKMPHLLIAGATGSGKSVCINTIIMSILYKSNPEDVKFIMIDPKVVELSVYNGIPHLLIPVVTDPKKAAGALHWAVEEMTKRYKQFADAGVRDMKGYNSKIKNGMIKIPINGETVEVAVKKMPQIVVIVDELADLMMIASSEVEEAICRLAQLARAAGIHLVIATQRPSVNVITGLIKANMPSRIAFSVTSGVDSRTILDMIGAEKLLGKGDMLYYPQGFTKPLRVQGAFVSDQEVLNVVHYIKEHNDATMDTEIEQQIQTVDTSSSVDIGGDSGGFSNERDLYFEDAGRLIIEKEKGSIGMLQRNFKVGFNRAARIMDQLEEAGIVGQEEGTKPRRVLVTLEEFQDILSNS